MSTTLHVRPQPSFTSEIRQGNCINYACVLLTASRRPESVGVLSMSASNTSSAPVLTYSRTKRRQEKKFNLKVEDKLLGAAFACILKFIFSLLSTSLRVFSACLFAGWRAALVSVLIQSLHRTPVNTTFTLDLTSHHVFGSNSLL